MSIFDYLLMGLAAWRLAYFIVKEDAPFDVMLKFRERTTLGGLLTCVYCASVWTALGCLLLYGTPGWIVVQVAAVSALALMLASYTGVGRP